MDHRGFIVCSCTENSIGLKMININESEIFLTLKAPRTRNEARSQCQGQSDPKWYAPLRHPKRNQHTKFGIPTSNNIGDMLQTRLSQ